MARKKPDILSIGVNDEGAVTRKLRTSTRTLFENAATEMRLLTKIVDSAEKEELTGLAEGIDVIVARYNGTGADQDDTGSDASDDGAVDASDE